MTLGPNKEHAMKDEFEELDESLDADGFRLALALRIRRFLANKLELCTTCENTRCRRAKRCAGPDCECVDKWQATLPPLSEEEASAAWVDFKKALTVRISLGENAT